MPLRQICILYTKAKHFANKFVYCAWHFPHAGIRGLARVRYDTPLSLFLPFGFWSSRRPFSSGLMAFGGSGAEVQLAALCCRAREKARRGQFPSFLPISEPAGEATSDPGVSRMHSSARLKISTLLESYHSWCFLTRRASRRPPKLDLDFD